MTVYILFCRMKFIRDWDLWDEVWLRQQIREKMTMEVNFSSLLHEQTNCMANTQFLEKWESLALLLLVEFVFFCVHRFSSIYPYNIWDFFNYPPILVRIFPACRSQATQSTTCWKWKIWKLIKMIFLFIHPKYIKLRYCCFICQFISKLRLNEPS
jgi:hypothetical protein